MAVLALLLAIAVAQPVRAQAPSMVSILVLEVGGKLLPLEQFQAEVAVGCPLGGSDPRPHFRTRSGGPAIALDNTEVRAPDPKCGFGLVDTNAPESAPLRAVDVPVTLVEAWTARTGILVVSNAAPASTPAAGVNTSPVPPLTLPMRLAMVGVLALAAGLVTGLVAYMRGRLARRRYEAADISAMVDERHTGMFTLAEPKSDSVAESEDDLASIEEPPTEVEAPRSPPLDED